MAEQQSLRYATLMRLVPSLQMLLLLSLGACTNRVVSEGPWFGPAVAATGPKLLEGVWLVEDSRCKLNEAEPAERWPGCATWGYKRGDQSLSAQWVDEGTGRHRIRTYLDWEVSESLLVDGDPLILQNTDCPQPATEAEVLSDSSAAVPTVNAHAMPLAEVPVRQSRFCYEAVRAIGYDGDRHITAVETWPVLCGPWPDNGGKVTDKPWPGLLLRGEDCVAASEAALRDAAKRSREVAGKMQFVTRWHWVRRGYH